MLLALLDHHLQAQVNAQTHRFRHHRNQKVQSLTSCDNEDALIVVNELGKRGTINYNIGREMAAVFILISCSLFVSTALLCLM